ncbi:3-ketoacyl-ACP reductase [Jiella sp. MQZ13P-4]|uniref:3-ketoacyl-ACP reductase n=1 Tax=Jiella sonneratiae TaxID=2816856 RepID=A0ABS3J885_9HYPH|nr:3-ketoacyl-ACP reductase [Jiella sonneratiae]
MLVTGGGSGIGHATAQLLRASGFDVATAGPNEAPAGWLDPAPPGAGRAGHFLFDLAETAAHGPLLDRIEQEFGPITCLVNNAGVTSLVRGDLLDLSPESFDRSVAVNLRGTFFLTQALARRFLARPEDRARSIVTITSVNAQIVGENRGDFCMTKAGLSMMVALFASRLADAGIPVFEIRPGIIATAMTEPARECYTAFIGSGGVPAGRWGTAEDVARAVLTLVAGGLPYATGIRLEIAGGMQIHRV